MKERHSTARMQATTLEELVATGLLETGVGCRISPQAVFEPQDEQGTLRPIKLGDHVVGGAGAVLCGGTEAGDGARIEEHAIVGKPDLRYLGLSSLSAGETAEDYAVRACGDLVPLVVEVDAAELGVWVKVHDPDRCHLPRRSGVQTDYADAESGRGLPLVDYFAPGWDVAVTPIGKQIRAQLPYGETDHV